MGNTDGTLKSDYLTSSNNLIKLQAALARCLIRMECPIPPKVVSLIPGQSVYKRQLIDVSLSFSPFLTL